MYGSCALSWQYVTKPLEVFIRQEDRRNARDPRDGSISSELGTGAEGWPSHYGSEYGRAVHRDLARSADRSPPNNGRQIRDLHLDFFIRGHRVRDLGAKKRGKAASQAMNGDAD